MKRIRECGSILALAFGLAHLLGCGGSGDGTVVPNFVTAFIMQAAGPAGSVNGLSDQGPPTPAGGPDAVVTPVQVATINGGAYPATLTSTQPFSQIFIWITVGGRLQTGLWHVTLTAPTTSAQVDIEVPDLPGADRFEVNYALTDSSGNFGNPAVTYVRLIYALNGEIQAAVTWDTLADVDLYVTDPAAETVFFGNRTSASGGVLDIDSNAACNGVGEMVENIVWPGTAPAGTYTVEVALFSDCGSSATGTNFFGVLRVKGANPQISTFQGAFAPGTTSTGTLTQAALTYTP